MLYEYHFDWITLICLFIVCGGLAASRIWIIKNAGKAADKHILGVPTVLDKMRLHLLLPVSVRRINAGVFLGLIILFFAAAFFMYIGNHIIISHNRKIGKYETVSGYIKYKNGAPGSKKFTVDGVDFFEPRLDYRKIKNNEYITVSYIPDNENTILFITNNEKQNTLKKE